MKSLVLTLSQLVFTLLMYFMGSIFFGIAIMPGLALLMKVWLSTGDSGFITRLFYVGVSVSLAYFMFGLTLILLVGLVRTVLRLRLREGSYPMFSVMAMKWSLISSLYLMIQYTFIDFVLLTPIANLLFRMLGAEGKKEKDQKKIP